MITFVYMEKLIEEFKLVEKMKLFEIEVFNKSEKENEFLTFDISIDVDNNTLVAQHVALTNEEEQSDKIAFKSVDLDDCFSLDELLQELYNTCLETIIDSEFYELID